MNEKIKDILEEIKYQLTNKKSEFYAIIIFIIILMLLFYPIPFILLQKTAFKYTGHLYILTICLYVYFSIIHQNKDIEKDFLHIFKLLEKVLPCIMASVIAFCIGPLF